MTALRPTRPSTWVASVVTVAVTMAIGCSNPDPTSPEALNGDLTHQVQAGPTPRDEDFIDELKAGTFTVCKVAEGSGLSFRFETTAIGPGVSEAPVYEPEVSLADGQCADVYTAPEGTGIGPDLVTITEDVPAGYHVARVAVWSLEEQEDGSFETTFHELPAETTTVEGQIDAGKIGCVVIFYDASEPSDGPGTGTPGYWHKPENWPVDAIEIGGTTYTKEEATDLIDMPVRGDKTKTMFPSLVAAKLNVIIGNDDSCIADAIAEADVWMEDHPVGSGVRGDSEAWDAGEPLHEMLDDYNNGLLCAPHRD